jgi:hypothetical protein
MANTLTDLIPDAYAAIDQVSRELTGLIPAVTMDARFDRAAKGQVVRVPIVPANSAGFDVTPAMTLPAAADQTIGNADVTISKSRGRPFSWNGTEQVGLNNGGPGYANIRVNQIAQAIRGLVNEVEADLASLQSGFSRAYGTAGATPFATANDFTDATEALKILKDNGAPAAFDNHLVMNTSAGAKFLGKQGTYNTNGDATILRQGIFLSTSGFDLRESAQIVTATAGTGASATTNNAGYAIGATTITLASAGTGTILAGDVISFANDPRKYVVATGDGDVSGGGTIVLNAPGLMQAIPAAATNITVVATSARNMAFNRNAIVLATRLPERPEEGDLALDVQTIVDPRTGLAFELAIYPGQRMVRYEVALAWGVRNIKPEWTALLLG